MKKIFTLLTLLTVTLVSAQKFHKPVPGGIVSVTDNKSYYVVELEGKDSLQIYNALEMMVEKTFTGTEDKIIEKIPGKYIKAEGVIKNMVCGYYDIKFETEFKIKNGRYIFQYNKFNIERVDQGKRYTILLASGRNILNGQDGVSYAFNNKGKVIMKMSCYKSIISFLDQAGGFFDISDEFEKYQKLKKSEDDGW